MAKNKAVILDRDGVINEDREYVYKKKDFVFLPRVFEALQKLQSAGYLLIIITNQSGIGRGYYSKQKFFELNNYMLNELEKKNIKISKIYYCLHHPDESCDCRKPKPKLLEKAIKEFNLNEESCWVIGDKLSDVKIAENHLCKTILLESKYTKDINRFKLKNLYEACEYILKG